MWEVANRQSEESQGEKADKQKQYGLRPKKRRE
jgi:hypothetical protein